MFNDNVVYYPCCSHVRHEDHELRRGLGDFVVKNIYTGLYAAQECLICDGERGGLWFMDGLKARRFPTEAAAGAFVRLHCQHVKHRMEHVVVGSVA